MSDISCVMKLSEIDEPHHTWYGRTLAERFWSHVDRNGDCWIWTGSLRGRRYGNLGANGHQYKAHRVAYELCVGEIPDGLYVLHKCDNTKCVRPDHLFLGTQADNVRDAREKNRMPQLKGLRNQRGEKNNHAKLTWEKVAEIKQRLENGEVQHVIAADYGVEQTVVSSIKLGKTWGW